MKRLRMTTGLGGPDYNLTRGDEHEFADAEADRLIAAGFGELVSSSEDSGDAEKAAAEKAAAEKEAAEKPAAKKTATKG